VLGEGVVDREAGWDVCREKPNKIGLSRRCPSSYTTALAAVDGGEHLGTGYGRPVVVTVPRLDHAECHDGHGKAHDR
jgi:hypothetical protein